MINIEQLKQEVSEVTHEFDRKVAMQVIDYLHEHGYLKAVVSCGENPTFTIDIDSGQLFQESIKDMNQLKNAENLKNAQNPYEMDPDYQRYIQGNLKATKDSLRKSDEELNTFGLFKFKKL